MIRRATLLVMLLLATVANASEDLAGLWTAKKRFGPDGRGTLIVVRSRGRYTADLSGVKVDVTSEKAALSFSLPDRGGDFRGRLDRSGAISGHWFRYGTAVNGAGRAAPISASLVVLRPDGANRWRGAVDPTADTFTLYLFLQKRDDGSFSALLRNPEFDLGSQQGVERFVRDGQQVRLIGTRGGNERDVATGTYDAENDVLTLDFPSRGGHYDFVRASGDSGFYPRRKDPGRYVYQTPLQLDDGWPVSTLDAVGIDRATIEKLIQRIVDMPMETRDVPQYHGIVIARHGKLVLEEYFHDHGREVPHTTRSAGKSLSSIVIGAAMYAGVPLQLSSRVYRVMNGGSFPAGLEPQKKAMTLEHLLTMSGGFFCDDANDDAPGNEETMWDQTDEPDFYRYTMKVPLATPPGENAVYCSAMANLALGMAGRAAHESPLSMFDRLVGGPLKIRHYEWSLDGVGNPYGGGGVSLLLRDFAKLGQLMLNGGTWEGRRILSKEFVARATSPQYHLRKLSYGYFWWIEDFPYKNRTVRVFAARGAGGQTVTVVPELDLVVAVFEGDFSNRKAMFAPANNIVANAIVPATREAGDDPHGAVIEREYATPYGPSKDGTRVH
ncbi:MAG TPA: serine hydrolase [Thermoanaerobaculia bacterium]|jgi:CubicO group peptidase (beta-lactamase class C family)|nr:serine hydrolase [Thermoanaerobaculia bacterium]